MKSTFYITFQDVYWIKKNDILGTGTGQVRVLKVYRKQWWKRLLIWLSRHYDISYHPRINQVKVRQYG